MSYEGTEIGEYWDSLVDLEREMDHMSDLFKEAYQKEVLSTLEFIKENYAFVEKITIPDVKPIKIKTLEWIGDE